MPSLLHEFVIEMFRDHPRLAAEVLAGPMRVMIPEFDKAALSPGELPDVIPTEYRADAVVTLDGGDGPVFAVVVEVQLRADPRKRFSWPAYVATLHARLKCPAMLLIVCPDRTVATWCAQPVVVTDPGLVLTPVVLRPRQAPLANDAEMALLTLLPEMTRVSPEGFMTAPPRQHEYKSEFVRRFFNQGREEGKAEGKGCYLRHTYRCPSAPVARRGVGGVGMGNVRALSRRLVVLWSRGRGVNVIIWTWSC